MKIKLLVMDVDGTLTDGRIYIGPDGEVMKAFDIKDGYITFYKEYTNVVIVYNLVKINIQYLPQCINLIVGDWYENREGSALDNKSVSVAVSTALSRMLFMHSQPVK